MGRPGTEKGEGGRKRVVGLGKGGARKRLMEPEDKTGSNLRVGCAPVPLYSFILTFTFTNSLEGLSIWHSHTSLNTFPTSRTIDAE